MFALAPPDTLAMPAGQEVENEGSILDLQEEIGEILEGVHRRAEAALKALHAGDYLKVRRELERLARLM